MCPILAASYLFEAVFGELLLGMEGKAGVVDENMELVLLLGELLGKLVDRLEAGQVQVHHDQHATHTSLLSENFFQSIY